jgi:hypothetical protein
MVKLTFDDGSVTVIRACEWRSVRRNGVTGVARVRTLATGDAIVGEAGLTTIVGIEEVDSRA